MYAEQVRCYRAHAVMFLSCYTYLCQNALCVRGDLLDDGNRGCVPEVKHHVVAMSLNASGRRDTAQVLHISPKTVLHALRKKEAGLESVNTALLRTLTLENVAMDLV